MTLVTATQTLGAVDQLIARDHNAFAYPEAAEITPLLSDGTTERNYVLQSSALSVRQARREWVTVDTPDMHTIRGYASSKTQVLLTEEDGTVRYVMVMEFEATQRYVDSWDIRALLVETSDPDTPGS